MNDAGRDSRIDDLFAAHIRGETVPWRTLEMTSDDLTTACEARDLTGLVADRLFALAGRHDWPDAACAALVRKARIRAAQELLRQREIATMLCALAEQHVHPCILKGTTLAYSLYDSPSARPRVDVDLLIRCEDAESVRRVMARLGYDEPPHCDGALVSTQFTMSKMDRFGVHHQYDVHWKVSNQPAFADLLSFDEVAASAIPLPALAPHARGTAPIHALLLACVHPVMHHGNVEWLLWSHDIHLIAGRLSAAEWRQFADLASARHASAVCAHQLNVARGWFATQVPDSVMLRLSTAGHGEATAEFLRPNRRVLDEAWSKLRALPRYADRLRLVREAVFPSRGYMMRRYGVSRPAVGTALLPLLYLHRAVAGSWKLLSRRAG